MRTMITASLLAIALAACTNAGPADDTAAATPPPLDQPAEDVPPATAPPPAAVPGLARFDGYGDMRFGMAEADARAAWGGDLSGDAGDGCHYLNPVWEHPPAHFAFMFDGGNGKLVFETDAAGKVSAWRAGVEPQVDYVEGCS